MKNEQLTEKIVSFAKDGDLCFPGSEIYGGTREFMGLWAIWHGTRETTSATIGGIFLYSAGRIWWGLNQRSYHASENVGSIRATLRDFTNFPLVEDKATHKRYRVDHLLEISRNRCCRDET